MQSVTGRAEFKHEYHSLGISMCAPLENHLSDHDIGFNGNHFTLQILTECLPCVRGCSLYVIVQVICP